MPAHQSRGRALIGAAILVIAIVVLAIALARGDPIPGPASAPATTAASATPARTTAVAPTPTSQAPDTDAQLAELFQTQATDVQVRGQGTVDRLLADDDDGSRHQRFILRLASGQTLLVAHNIDLAPRLDGLQVGDVVAFYGEYVYTAQGGTIHWTHRDPAGRHVAGWLEWDGRRFA